MRVATHDMQPPAALVFQDDNAILLIRVGLLAPGIVAFLDRLLSAVHIS